MRWIALCPLLVVAAALISGCTGGDSTVAKTPTNTIGIQPSSPPVSTDSTTGPPAPTVDPCAVSLKDPAIATAVAQLPPAPNTEAKWNPVPIAGNYNKCSALSAVIVAEDSHDAHPGTRAVFFHLGDLIADGVPDTYGFNAIDLSASTLDTVVLNFSNGIPGLDSVVSFHWNGSGVEVVRPTQ